MPKPKPIRPDQLGLTPEQCAAKVPCGRTLIYDEIAQGRLKARKLRRRTIVLPEDLERWISSLPVADESNRFRPRRQGDDAPEAA